MNERMNEWTNERMNERTNERINDSTRMEMKHIDITIMIMINTYKFKEAQQKNERNQCMKDEGHNIHSFVHTLI